MNEPNLMQIYKFTADDLQANRRGQLSVAQQKRWVGAGKWSGKVIKTAVPLITAFVILLFGIVTSIFLDQWLICMVVSVLAAGGAGIGLWFLMGRMVGRDTSETIPAVQRAEDIAHLKKFKDRYENNYSMSYRLEIDHHSFQIFRREQFEALEDGGRYIVYYLDDDNKYIVSLEKAA